jgi:hypothetical protein
MEQADLFLWDEAAFTRNNGFEPTWTAALPTLGDYGKAFVISTGNGPAEAPGDGQGFAELFTRAATGQEGEAEPPMTAVFLPDDVAPERDDVWRERERKKFLSDAAFEQEHSKTAEEALQGKQGAKVYPLDGIAAAVKLGAELDAQLADASLSAPAGSADGMLAVGIDWGAFSHLLPVWELEGGGVYVPPGEHASGPGMDAGYMEVSDKMRDFLEGVLEHVQRPYGGRRGPLPKIGVVRFDAAGKESMAAAVRYVAEHREDFPGVELVLTNNRRRPLQVRTLRVAFGSDAVSGQTGRRANFKTFTIQYLTWLFNRTANIMRSGGARVGVIAISPKNPVLIRQLRGLEFKDDGTGRIEKVDDHGPDALIAGTAPIAVEHRGRRPLVEDERRAA